METFSGNLQIKNPLGLPLTGGQQEIELHGFREANLQGYGVCVWLRAVLRLGVPSVHLVALKSRHALIKSTTIPRLELLENFLLSRFMAPVKNALSVSNYLYWTDSKVTLAWINWRHWVPEWGTYLGGSQN